MAGEMHNLLFLSPLDVHEHAVEAEYALFQCCGLLGDLAGFSWSFPSGLALDHDVEVE